MKQNSEISFSGNILTIEGDLSRVTVPSLANQFARFERCDFQKIDLGAVKKIDSAGVSFLDELRQSASYPEPKIINASQNIQTLLNIFSSDNMSSMKLPAKENIFAQIGQSYFDKKEKVLSAIILTADIFYWSFVGILNKKGQRKDSILSQSLLIGVDAIGIIALLSFIIGLILALQSAAQLRQFGANIYMADLLAISMVREMGPMMTAIIIAGRSGSAIASEIATMKVTEEIDALKMMAINPIRYIVVPKMIAITICMPLLVTLSIIIGILGGLLIGVTYLDLSVTAFYLETISILNLKDVLVGLSKSVFFAWVIVIIGSFFGFQATGGSEGVGISTTKSVVVSIFFVIVLDAIFSLVFLI